MWVKLEGRPWCRAMEDSLRFPKDWKHWSLCSWENILSPINSWESLEVLGWGYPFIPTISSGLFFLFFNWRIDALQNFVFCQTSTWISHVLCVSRSVVSDSAIPQTVARRLLCPWDSLGKNTGVDCHSLFQRIFLTQWSNPGLLHCRQILYHLNYRESATGIHMSPPSWTSLPPSPSRLIQGPCLSSLRYIILSSLFLAALGLRYCTWAFSSCSERGLCSSCGTQDFSWLLLL